VPHPERPTDPRPVRLGLSPEAAPRLAEIGLESTALAGAPVEEVLAWAVRLAEEAPLPGRGATLARWELLATVAAQSLTVARVVEPHLDAVAILAEQGEAPPPASSWGVWAAEGPGQRLTASADGTGWVLDGTKPWCSLAGSVSHALVTAWVSEADRRLFALELQDPGVHVDDATWAPTGLARVTTTPVTMHGVRARPVGETGWYLRRDGFWWGGIGVAAVWYGGAVALARRLAEQARSREPDQITLLHLGQVDTALAAAGATLADAAARVDRGHAGGHRAVLLGARVRHVVATAAEQVLGQVAHALGPGPLSQEPDHATRVADLELYLRQHHAERDAAGLGRILLDDPDGAPPW